MATPLTPHDHLILSKIHDPESSAPLQPIDPSLPRDPHITDATEYQSLISREHQILQSIFQADLDSSHSALTALNTLITSHPTYASARNNRAQALRLLYGTGVLVSLPSPQNHHHPHASWPETWPLPGTSPSPSDFLHAGKTILHDLAAVVRLLTPASLFSVMSPQAAKTLSKAHAQRGALYLRTAAIMGVEGAVVRVGEGAVVRVGKGEGAMLRIGIGKGEEYEGEGGEEGYKGEERKWGAEEWRVRGEKEFELAARYGDGDARKMLVAANPAARLCGEIVREAMRREVQWGGV